MKNEEKNSTLAEKKSEVKAKSRALFRSFFFLIVAVVVLIFAVIAWFVYNNTVTSNSSAISAKKYGFELESDGDEINVELESYLDDSILHWKLNADSNLNNDNDHSGIRPNSSGSLSFYVVPLNDGPLNINCTLDIRPVMKDKGDASNISVAAEKILRGHLLFAYEYTCGENTYKDLVDVHDGTFQIQLPNAKAEQRQKITLNWFWPYTLYDANNHAEYGNKISAMAGNQEYSDYFYYDENGSVNVNSAFKILNQCYNDADQLIGDEVEAVVLELTADLAS